SARCSDGVINAVAALHAIEARMVDRPDDVDQQSGRRWHVEVLEAWELHAAGRLVRLRVFVHGSECAESYQDGERDDQHPAAARNQADWIAHAADARGAPSWQELCLLRAEFRGKDSNLRSRIQSPLPYHLATAERAATVPRKARATDWRRDLRRASVVGSFDEVPDGLYRGSRELRAARCMCRLPLSGRTGPGHRQRQRPRHGRAMRAGREG